MTCNERCKDNTFSNLVELQEDLRSFGNYHLCQNELARLCKPDRTFRRTYSAGVTNARYVHTLYSKGVGAQGLYYQQFRITQRWLSLLSYGYVPSGQGLSVSLEGASEIEPCL